MLVGLIQLVRRIETSVSCNWKCYFLLIGHSICNKLIKFILSLWFRFRVSFSYVFFFLNHLLEQKCIRFGQVILECYLVESWVSRHILKLFPFYTTDHNLITLICLSCVLSISFIHLFDELLFSLKILLPLLLFTSFLVLQPEVFGYLVLKHFELVIFIIHEHLLALENLFCLCNSTSLPFEFLWFFIGLFASFCKSLCF